jgi:hypothetical protein
MFLQMITRRNHIAILPYDLHHLTVKQDREKMAELVKDLPKSGKLCAAHHVCTIGITISGKQT